MTFAKKCRYVRTKVLKLSQQEMAFYLGLSNKYTYINWETGRRVPRGKPEIVKKIEKLCETSK